MADWPTTNRVAQCSLLHHLTQLSKSFFKPDEANESQIVKCNILSFNHIILKNENWANFSLNISQFAIGITRISKCSEPQIIECSDQCMHIYQWYWLIIISSKDFSSTYFNIILILPFNISLTNFNLIPIQLLKIARMIRIGRTGSINAVCTRSKRYCCGRIRLYMYFWYKSSTKCISASSSIKLYDIWIVILFTDWF